MVRLLHVADVHLGAPLRGFGREAEARRAETLDAFRALPSLALEREVDAVLIAGDLFDGPRPSEATAIAVQETVRRLTEQELPVFAVPGNHDARALNPDLYPRTLRAAVVFTEPAFGPPQRVPVGDTELFVYGCAYDAAEEPDPLATFAREPGEGVHVVLLHGSVPGAPHWERGSSLPISWEALEGLGVDYVGLGDLHRFQGPDELRGAPACYPGSFAAVDVTEDGLRGPVVAEVAPGAGPRIERVSSGVREVGAPRPLDVSRCGSDLEVADRISEGVGPEIPNVVLEGEPTFPLDADAIAAILEERHNAVHLVDRSAFFDRARLEEIADRSTVAGHVARLGLRAIADAKSEEERAGVERGLRVALRVMEVS